MKTKTFKVNPVGKPRMSQSDKWNWKNRPCVLRYYQYKAKLQSQANGFKVPDSFYHLVFYIPMPKSWSKRKKEEMNGKPHQQKPDKDNLEKAFLDALCSEDSYIWDGRVTKIWAYEGKIVCIWV